MIKRKPLMEVFAVLILSLVISCTSGDLSKVKMSADDSITAKQLHKKAHKLLLSDPDSALHLLTLEGAVHRRTGNGAGLMDCYYMALYIHSNIKLDTGTTRKYVDSAWRLANLHDNEQLRYKAYAGYGDYYYAVDNYPMASQYYIKALETQPQPIDSAFFLNTTGSLAHILYYQQNKKAASDFYEPVMRANEKVPASPMKVSTFLNGTTFADMESDEGKARAGKYLFAARQVAETIKDNCTNTLLFDNLASYYKDLGMTDSSSYFAQKAIEGWETDPTYLDDPVEPFVILAQNNLEQGKYAKAKQTLQQLEHKVGTLVFQEMPIEALYYDAKYKVANQEGDLPAAFKALERRTDLNDRLSGIAKEQQTLNYTADIKKLSAEKTIAAKNNQLEKQRIYSVSLVIVSLLLLMLTIMIYLYWRKQKKLETQKWQNIEQVKEYEGQMKLLEERSRIAREMHDDLGSTLTSTLMAVELVKQKPGDQMPLEMMDRSANQLSDQINDIIWNMNTKNDNLQSLCDYILRFASIFLRDASILFSWQENIPEEEVCVEGGHRRGVYLCVKELMNNVVKHSGATKVQFQINYSQGQLYIRIEDNGVGLNGKNNENEKAGSGYGLGNIRKSIAVLNGTVEWQSNDQGTNVQISIPL
jgi:signal transduction histidine kinase